MHMKKDPFTSHHDETWVLNRLLRRTLPSGRDSQGTHVCTSNYSKLGPIPHTQQNVNATEEKRLKVKTLGRANQCDAIEHGSSDTMGSQHDKERKACKLKGYALKSRNLMSDGGRVNNPPFSPCNSPIFREAQTNLCFDWCTSTVGESTRQGTVRRDDI